MDPHVVIEFVRAWAPWLPLLVAALDTAGLPLPLPAELLLIVAGSFAAGGLLPLALALPLGALAAIAGDHVGFLVGRRLGARVAARRLRRFSGIDRPGELAGAAVRRYGALAVPVARFIPGVRTVVMLLAGGFGVRYRWFLIADILGAAAWSTGYLLLGISLGPSWYEAAADRVGWEGLAVLLIATLAGAAAYAYRRRLAGLRLDRTRHVISGERLPAAISAGMDRAVVAAGVRPDPLRQDRDPRHSSTTPAIEEEAMEEIP